MTTLPQLGLTLPTRGPAGSGHWADVLDANFALIDAHDHRSGGGARITPAAININSDLSFNSSWAVTALNRATFTAVTPPAVNKSVWVGDGTGGTTANELYWTTNVGANVKITNGSALNVGAFVGGIGGDYAGSAAQFNYNDGQKSYDAKEGTADANGWARVRCGGLRLIEFNTSESFYVEHLAPAGLAAAYAMTWPTALPASTKLVQINNAGQIAFANTSIVMEANQSITLSGTGEYKHGNRTLVLSPAEGWAPTGTFAPDASGNVACSASGNWFFVVPLHTGDRVQSYTIAGIGDGSVDVTFELYYIPKTGGAGTTKATATITNAAAAWNDATATVGAPAALAAGEVCIAKVNPNATGFTFNNIRIVYDRP